MSAGNVRVIVRGCQNLDPYRELVDQSVLDGRQGLELGLIPCSSKVEAHQVLKIFEQGADGLLILACPIGACRFREGNIREAKRIAYAAKWLEQIGVDGRRISFKAVEPRDMRDLPNIIKSFYSQIAGLGPKLNDPAPAGGTK